MKKSKKLLSLLLAVIMILSTMSMSAYAYEAYGNGDQSDYNTNDMGLAMLYSDEQRASFFCDTINGVLKSLNINQNIPIIGDINLTSLDATMDTIDGLKTLIGVGGFFANLGIIEDLDLNAINKNISVTNDGGAVQMLNALLDFLNANADRLGRIIEDGDIPLGDLSGAVDLSSIKPYLADVPDFIKSNLYWLGQRYLPDGIGDDTALPDDPDWAELGTKWTVDQIVSSLISDALLAPRWTTNITNPAQNDIASNPAKYGIDASYIHSEPAVDSDGNPIKGEDGNQLTYYYVYATKAADGSWEYSVSGTEDEKHYIQHWDMDSILVPEADRDAVASLLDFQNKSLYDIADEAILWAYNAYGAQNLDGQFRATLMQFTGAVNNGLSNSAEDEAIKAELVAKMESYTNTYKDPVSLARALEKEVGIAGNRNFMYIARDGKPIGESNDLYYVVEWYGWREFYKVTFPAVGENGKRGLFDLADWEYQIDDWATVSEGWAGDESVLKRVNNIAGNILKDVIKDLNWSFDAKGAYTNANLETNLDNLIKLIIKTAPERFFGGDFTVPADFDSYTLEQVATMVAVDLVTWLMPALVLPEKDAKDMCLEEVAVYAVREFIAEIMPEYSWDAKINAATSDADYLDILLNMGTSIGAYYLKEVAGLGTHTDHNGTTSKVNVPMGPDTTWETQLNFILDEMIDMWLPNLSKKVKANNPDAFASGDALVKFTAIANDLFPGILSLISGCSGTVGSKTYAVDLRVVKNLLAGLLNGEIVPIAEKLYRNSAATCYANDNLYTIIVKMLKDFFGGLGCKDVNGWSQLTGPLDKAIDPAQNGGNPLDSIITKTNLKDIIAGLIKTLYSVKDLWVQDGIAILMQIAGTMGDLTFTGADVKTNSAYYGTSVTVKPVIYVSSKGIPSIYFTGGYGTGTPEKDGFYTAKLKRLLVTDFDGQPVPGGDVTMDTVLTFNEEYTYDAGITLSPTNQMAIYNLEAYIEVTAPDGTVINDGEPITVTTSFMMTSAEQGDDTQPNVTANGKWYTTSVWNTYIEETDPYLVGSDKVMTVTNTERKSRHFFIEGYGWNKTNPDTGRVYRGEAVAGAATWGVSINGGAETVAEMGSDERIPFFWNWNEEAGTNIEIGEYGGTGSAKQWLVDQTIPRDSFTEDFVTLRFDTNSAKEETKTVGIWGSKGNWPFNKPYIVIYNSYGLKNLIASCLTSGRVASNYSEASWKTYTDALKAAVAEYYMPRNAATFANDHMTGGVSDFKTCSEALQKAIDGLELVVEEELKDFTPAEKDAFAKLENALKAEDKLDLRNMDYIMYRWLKYYNEYAYLYNILDSTKAPSKVLYPSLAGVDGKDVQAVLDSNADLKAALTLLTTPVDPEDQAAADKAYSDFYNNLPKINLTDLKIDAAQMVQYRQRLIKDGSYDQYLKSAISLVEGRAKAADYYTPESWANYQAYLATAKDVASTALPHSIHGARYELLVAFKALMPKTTAADFTALEAFFTAEEGQENAIEAILNHYSELELADDATVGSIDEAVAQLIKAAGYEVTVGEETYTVGGSSTGLALLAQKGMLDKRNSQADIDAKVAEIEAALANFKTAGPVELEKTPTADEGFIIDNSKTLGGKYTGIIYGFDKLGPTIFRTSAYLESALAATNGGSLEFGKDASGRGYGTGATVTLKDAGGNVVATYVVVIFGDITGDGLVNVADVREVVSAASDPYYLEDNSLNRMAANCHIVKNGTMMHTVNVGDVRAIVNYADGSTEFSEADLATMHSNYPNYQ